MAYLAKRMANAILSKSFSENCRDMTPMKLQKMLYFVNGWGLALTGEPFINVPFEAWPYGPVIPEIYDLTRHYRANPIESYLYEMCADNQERAFSIAVSDENKNFHSVLNAVWEKYSHYDAYILSEMTHETNGPWWKARQYGNPTIRNDDIKKYFIDLAQRGKDGGTTSR